MLRTLPAVLATALLGCTIVASPAHAYKRFCASADALQFGSRTLGSSTSTTVTITSCGDEAWSFSDVSLHASTGSAFQVRSSCATGRTLAPGESCSVEVTFAPLAAGQASGALWLRQTSTTPDQLLTFYGRGVSTPTGGALARFSPAVATFGSTLLGERSEWATLTLTNSGTATLVPNAMVIDGGDPDDFAVISSGDPDDCAVGRAIVPGASCTLILAFQPRSAGLRTAQLVVGAPQLAAPAALPLRGTGIDAKADSIDVIEFFHAARNHYFVTTEAAEAAMIDAGGVGPGWVRTGHGFRVWPVSAQPPFATQEACRFFGAPGVGPDAHFFTAFTGECAGLQRSAAWTFEGLAFRTAIPEGGRCEDGFDPVVRLYWSGTTGSHARHRYVKEPGIVASMAHAGWIVEGPVFCSPR